MKGPALVARAVRKVRGRHRLPRRAAVTPFMPAQAGIQPWVPACAGTSGHVHRFDCQTALSRKFRQATSPPVFFVEAPGPPVFPFPTKCRGSRPPQKGEGSGAPSGAAGILPLPRSGEEHGRLSALHGRRFLIPGPRFQEHALGCVWRPRRAGLTPERAVGGEPVLRRPVQRAPRRRVVVPNGSVPGTSRCRGNEPRQRAPHQPASGTPAAGPLRRAAASPAALPSVAPSS